MLMDLLQDFLASLLVVLTFLGLPVIIVSANRRAVRMPAVREFVQIPLLPKLTISGGIVLGVVIACLAAKPELVRPAQIFASPGPWDITFVEFLRDRVNPLAFDYAAAARAIHAGGPFDGLALSLLFVAGALTAAISICFRVWYIRGAMLASSLCLLTILCTAYLVVYACAGFMWLLNHMNFLIFIVPLMFVRKYARLFGSIP